MIKNVRSIFILKTIIAHIEEEKKLYLFCYNKKIQNILNIDIINYILYSNKYKIEEKNGIRKEYNSVNNKLIFKGEYKNGKRNGLGFYYDNTGNIIFKGTFKDGKKNGKGTEYYLGDHIKFEGEYFNGFPYNGRGYDCDNNLVYELKNGCGHVKLFTFLNKLIFEGEYLDGVKNGFGREYNNDSKLIFEGEYLNGEKHGTGKEYFKDGEKDI